MGILTTLEVALLSIMYLQELRDLLLVFDLKEMKEIECRTYLVMVWRAARRKVLTMTSPWPQRMVTWSRTPEVSSRSRVSGLSEAPVAETFIWKYNE